jgi:hypothetical protein
MAQRTVTGKIRKLNEPWVDATVLFRLIPGSYSTDSTYPTNSIFVKTDSEGIFSVSLWTNEEGARSSVYVYTNPSNESYKFTLPPGNTPISITTLIEGGITPIDPQYATLLTYVDDRIAAELGGGFVIPFSFGDASPKIIQEAFIGKITEVSLVIEVPFNGTGSTISIGTVALPELLLPIDYNSPNLAADFVRYPIQSFLVPTNIVMVINPGGGTTQGSGYVTLSRLS